MHSIAQAAWATWILLLVAVVISAAAMTLAVWLFDRFEDKP